LDEVGYLFLEEGEVQIVTFEELYFLSGRIVQL
jgi:hypothetical protein